MRSHLLATAIIASLGLVSTDAFAAKASAPAVTTAQLEQLQAQIAALQAQVQELKAQSDSLQAQSDAQSEVNVVQAKAVEDAASVSSKVDGLSKLVDNTKVSGRMFFDVSSVDRSQGGKKVDSSSSNGNAKNGLGFDVKRFYLTVDHKFDNIWSARLTTDFEYNSTSGANQLFVKHAYLQGAFDPAFTLRIGSADMPWIGYVDKWHGYRYIENSLVDRMKAGNSADWGVHVLGDTGLFNYQVSVANGAGYKKLTRSGGVDVEGRAAWTPVPEFTVAVGGYSGKIGSEYDYDGAADIDTITRGDLLVAYASPAFRLGGEYFVAKNLSPAAWTYLANGKESGWSVWGSARVTDGGINLLARYDKADLAKTLNPAYYDKYWYAGVEFPVIKGIKLAAVYKNTETLNSSSSPLKIKEFGVWGDVQF
ncbi:MAG: porin [Pseudomonas sp.]